MGVKPELIYLPNSKTMSKDEKAARAEGEHQQDGDEAATLIRRLQAENEAKNVKQVGLVEALYRIEHEAVIRPKYRAVETVSDLRQIARAAIEEVNRE